MKVHEYQAKQLLREFGVPVPRGDVADTPARAREVATRLGGRVVVKAQVHAGGRGKAGGIKLADTPADAERAAGEILGMRLRTPQTPPEGILVRAVWVEEASAIDRELYLSITLDRTRSAHVVMGSRAGGMDIEEVAARTPEAILREWAHPALGLGDVGPVGERRGRLDRLGRVRALRDRRLLGAGHRVGRDGRRLGDDRADRVGGRRDLGADRCRKHGPSLPRGIRDEPWTPSPTASPSSRWKPRTAPGSSASTSRGWASRS